MSELEEILGYEFSDRGLLEEALRHPSSGEGRFELLEFLGDRVLGLAVAEILYSQRPEIKIAASKFSKLVSSDLLVEVSKPWKIEEFLKHSIDSGLSNKVIADACEAILGAIYFDGGYQEVFKIVQRWWTNHFDRNIVDPKMHLQEISQAKRLGIPVYKVLESRGPSHAPEYTVSVEVIELGEASGKGRSKQEASKNAAVALLKKLIEDV